MAKYEKTEWVITVNMPVNKNPVAVINCRLSLTFNCLLIKSQIRKAESANRRFKPKDSLKNRYVNMIAKRRTIDSGVLLFMEGV